MSAPPHNHELERSYLGAMLQDAESLAWAESRALLEYGPETFWAESHRLIHRAMERVVDGDPAQNIQGQPLDVALLADELERAGDLERVGGLPYLTRLSIGTEGIPSQAAAYARALTNYAVRRKAMARLSELEHEAAHGARDLEGFLARCYSDLEGLRPSSQREAHSARSLAKGFFDQFQAREEGQESPAISTGISALDGRIRGGLRPGELICVGAATGMGKSAFCLHLARVAAMEGKLVYYVTTEMGGEDVFLRALAQASGVSATTLEDGQLSEAQYSKMVRAMGPLAAAPLYVDDDPYLTTAKVCARARRQKVLHGVDLLVVDYIQRLKVDDSPHTARRNREENVAESAKRLQQLARDLQIPVVIASQVTSRVDEEKRPPTARDTRESRVVGHESHVFIGLYREAYYATPHGNQGKPGKEPQRPLDPTRLEAWVDHKRGCKPGMVPLFWGGETLQIAPLEERYEVRGLA